MQRSNLYAGGLPVPPLAAGCWRMHEWSAADRHRWVDACLELDITTFDHADIYGDMTCEALFGEVIRASPARRARMTLVSKCGIRLPGTSPGAPVPVAQRKTYDTSAAHLRACVENSLVRLGTDYLDLLLIHRPDPLLDAGALAEAVSDLHRAGKIRHFGVSNHGATQLAALQSRLDLAIATNQVELSAWKHDLMRDAVIDQCLQTGMRPMAWSPLGGGRISNPSPVRDALMAAARETGSSADVVALAWLMQHPSRPIPILGTSRLDRLAEQARSVDLSLSREQWFAIYEAGLPGGLP
ncbi:MAG TPA: aldo/keto reductase [Usitatibacteraceae bacterium]|nr:aldo/keto reductase [Usitatibacteraceae bacterium]